MTFEAFDHFTVRAADLDASKRFYQEALGLRCEPRPGATVPALLVFLGDQAIVHLFEAAPELETIYSRLRAPDSAQIVVSLSGALPENLRGQWRTGRLHHISFRGRDPDTMRSRLLDQGVAFRERTLPTGTTVILANDPDGVEIEMTFAPPA